MKNEEKIYQTIREAAQKAEEKPFLAMDKVWNRVEEKLDTKIIKKKSEVWRKTAIAASFFLFFTAGILLFTTQKELNSDLEFPKKTIESIAPEATIPGTISEPKKTEILEIKANKVEEEKVKNEVYTNNDLPENLQQDKTIEENKPSLETDDRYEVAAKSKEKTIDEKKLQPANNQLLFQKSRYDALSSTITYERRKTEIQDTILPKKSENLMVIDGYLSKQKLEEIEPEEIKTYVELKNPIYIINGVEFSEESLFGDHPTSKYAPLSLQKIDSIKIFLPEEAIPIYGEKGKEGIVIISIKN